MKIFDFQKRKKLSGFTLIEVLVAVGVFLMTIIALSQIFVAVIRSEKVAYALLNSENNIRNSLESMARIIRMGKDFKLPDNTQLEFDYNITNECLTSNNCNHVIYSFDGRSLKETLTEGGSLVFSDLSMIDPEITIEKGSFEKIGNSPNEQPTIIIRLKAKVTVRGVDYYFNVQTAVTPRILQVEF